MRAGECYLWTAKGCEVDNLFCKKKKEEKGIREMRHMPLFVSILPSKFCRIAFFEYETYRSARCRGVQCREVSTGLPR